MKFDLLHSNRLYLVNCEISGGLVKAGWMWCDRYLRLPVEVLSAPAVKGFTVKVQIPDSIRNLKASTCLGFKDDTVDFRLVK